MAEISPYQLSRQYKGSYSDDISPQYFAQKVTNPESCKGRRSSMALSNGPFKVHRKGRCTFFIQGDLCGHSKIICMVTVGKSDICTGDHVY